METKIEGLILSKIPYQDRHLICHLLLRSGKRASVLFYGGQGGGKKKKDTILEVGHMLKVELKRTKHKSDLHHAKEWSAIWTHKNIRLDHKAFYLMCFYLEVVHKLSVEENLYDELRNEDKSLEGLFLTLSNGLLFLEKELKATDFNLKKNILVFLSKILLVQGVFPEREVCVLSENPIKEIDNIVLVMEQGGFADSSLVNAEDGRKQAFGESGKELWYLMGKVSNSKYPQLHDLELKNEEIVFILINYFCYQFHFSQSEFKSLPMIL
jgi:recombinational DNA repair protein (RecF pathway)